MVVDKIQAKVFLQDVVEGIYGDSKISHAHVQKFLVHASDRDVIDVLTWRDKFQSNWKEDPKYWMIVAVEKIVKNSLVK